MAEYQGLKAIARRIGRKDPETVKRWIVRKAFPAYIVKIPYNPTPVYHTNDDLIRVWELAQCQLTRDAIIKRAKAKNIKNNSITAEGHNWAS